ncbi:MAG: type II toxin-antitoxin system VapC family toxin [Acetobacteraceae bacterium]
MVFADASALVAMIAREPDALALADRLQTDRRRICSPLSAWETVAALCRSYALAGPAARSRVRLFLADLSFEFVGIGEPEFEVAADAYARFGKGRHPAALNMGDCFSYACATTNHAALLFKGDDFTRTDIEGA